MRATTRTKDEALMAYAWKQADFLKRLQRQIMDLQERVAALEREGSPPPPQDVEALAATVREALAATVREALAEARTIPTGQSVTSPLAALDSLLALLKQRTAQRDACKGAHRGLEVTFDAVEARARRYEEALKKIVACDYRGNMPPEQEIARAALEGES